MPRLRRRATIFGNYGRAAATRTTSTKRHETDSEKESEAERRRRLNWPAWRHLFVHLTVVSCAAAIKLTVDADWPQLVADVTTTTAAASHAASAASRRDDAERRVNAMCPPTDRQSPFVASRFSAARRPLSELRRLHWKSETHFGQR